MIRNTVVNTISYFYPLGNTPAVSLTQDLPHGKDADILLLGCGDARNVLFTCFADPNRKLDITCCDIEPAIVARNILLYTLIIDDVDQVKLNEIWNIYYHWRLDEKSLCLLEDQVEKLLCLSATISKWRLSAYGMTFRYCDERTLMKVRKFWNICSSRELSKAQECRRNKIWQARIGKAKKIRQNKTSGNTVFGGFRSGALTGLSALEDFPIVVERWWREGLTSSGKESTPEPNSLNPAFFSTVNENVTLHYGIDPLLGFPLATAYVPLSSNSNLFVKRNGTSSADYLVACAKQQFREWAGAFKRTVIMGLVLRFCVADALALSLTLKNAVLQENERLTANLFCDNWAAEPLVLDRDEYMTKKQAAPRRFDIIDTSNLIDHLGPLNLMPLCAALLKYDWSSTAYTEVLVQQDSTERERLTELLGGEVRTVALLLGLSPCEMWTNTTNSPEDNSMLKFYEENNERQLGGSTQIRSRLRWKRTYLSNITGLPLAVHFEASKVAQLLYSLYDHMFIHENLWLRMGPGLKNVLKSSNTYYNRASFVLLLKAIQETIITDWNQCLDYMHRQIYSGFSQSPIGATFAQELSLYMQMLGVDKRILSINREDIRDAKMASFFETWSEIPPYVCITLRIPREKLRPFTSKAGTEIGTPALRCDVHSGDISPNAWSNSFVSVQVLFGNPQLTRSDGVPFLQIDGDETGWLGQSDMFASTFIPTWMSLQPHEAIPIIKCGLLSTVQSTFAFVGVLGLTLDIFSTKVMSEKVTISRYMPAMSQFPILTGDEHPRRPQLPSTTTVVFSEDNMAVAGFIMRINFVSEEEQSTLRDRSVPVRVHFLDFFRASVKTGDQLNTLAEFPFPVNKFRHKVRIARKSSYVEIEVPFWNPLADSTSAFLFPVMLPRLSSGKPMTPVPWTATRVDLDTLSVTDLAPRKRWEWLTIHASTMFSTRERRIREARIVSPTSQMTESDVRVEIKEGLFSILMSYTGLQGHAAKFFGLSKEDNGINVIFVPSCCRLDLINRTIVLDAAAIPLTNTMLTNKKLGSIFQRLASQGLLQVRVTDGELRSWKSILPALAERCRVWEHRLNCEYSSEGEVPLSKGLEDGYNPLCSCGVGKFPANYVKDVKIDNIDYLLKNYGTRVAISPFFALPYVEDCFYTGLTSGTSTQSERPVSTSITGCGNCGGRKKSETGAGEEKLLVCSKCRQARYCSMACQKADWRNHKKICSKVP